MPALAIVLGFTMHDAIGTSLVVIAINAAVALAARAGSGQIEPSVLVPFTIAATVGVFVGSRIADRVSGPNLRRGFAVFLVALSAFIAMDTTIGGGATGGGSAADRVYAAGDCNVLPPPKAGIFAEGEARVAARNIAAEIDGGPGDQFDGTGYCFLEFPNNEPQPWRATSSPSQGQTFAWKTRTPRPTPASKPSRRSGSVIGSTSTPPDGA